MWLCVRGGRPWICRTLQGTALRIASNRHDNRSLAIAKQIEALSYLRVSTQGQVEGDGFPRQREAIADYAAKASMKVVDEFRDEGVSGTLPLGESLPAALTQRGGVALHAIAVAVRGVKPKVLLRSPPLARTRLLPLVEKGRGLPVRVLTG